MRNYRLDKAPRALFRPTVHLDNIALIPGSLLPLTAEWQAIANDLSTGETLIVLPSQMKQQHVARFVASHLRGKGRHVKMLS